MQCFYKEKHTKQTIYNRRYTLKCFSCCTNNRNKLISAALIDDDAGSLIAVGVMLHQIKAVTADLVLVNGVPRPDVSGNRQTGGIGMRRELLSSLLRQPPEQLGRGTTLKAAFNVFADA